MHCRNSSLILTSIQWPGVHLLTKASLTDGFSTGTECLIIGYWILATTTTRAGKQSSQKVKKSAPTHCQHVCVCEKEEVKETSDFRKSIHLPAWRTSSFYVRFFCGVCSHTGYADADFPFLFSPRWRENRVGKDMLQAPLRDTQSGEEIFHNDRKIVRFFCSRHHPRF